MSATTAYETALAAHEAGLCVLPPREDGSKAPDTTEWTSRQQRRSTREEIGGWYANGRTGVGFITGAVSDDLEALDFDERETYLQYRALAEAAGLGPVLDRVREGYLEETPGGGVHLLYRCSEISGNTKLAKRPKRLEEMQHPKDTIKTLIETRGEGGYIVAAPSNGRVHPSGGAYRQVKGGVATIVTITPEEREEFHALARTFDLMPKTEARGGRSAHTGSDGERPGDAYIASSPDVQGLLERHGWRVVYEKNGVVYLRRPSKDRGISATLGFVGPGVFFPFTTSSAFESERCYSPFAVYAVLEHGGDFRAAAKALRKAGYGTSSATDTDADVGSDAAPQRLSRDDFVADLETHKYIYRPTGKLWPRTGVNAAVPPVFGGYNEKGEEIWIPASDWLDERQPVHQLTWSPGDPEIIAGRLLNQGGWIAQENARAYNLYRPATIALGDPEQAGPWVDHVRRLYPEHADHIITWLAHRVQRPGEKINHAVLFGGLQGCGKDTVLKPVREAIGAWNFADASPSQIVGRLNGFLKSVILLVPELCDLGDVDRYGFYEHCKPIIAAPPATLRCDEKFQPETQVPNVTGVVFTSNLRIGIYLPAGDRRHFAAWSSLDPATLPEGYFDRLHRWLDHEHGCSHVAAYLQAVDLRDFNPNAPPPKTEWFWAIVDAGRAPEESELSTVLDFMAGAPGNDGSYPHEGTWPDAVTLAQLIAAEKQRVGWKPEDGRGNDFASWLDDRKNRRQIPHRLEAVGYVAIRNDAAKDGRWKVRGENVVIYARQELTRRDQLVAAQRLIEGAS
jgi:hypothetical protein